MTKIDSLISTVLYRYYPSFVLVSFYLFMASCGGRALQQIFEESSPNLTLKVSFYEILNNQGKPFFCYSNKKASPPDIKN